MGSENRPSRRVPTTINDSAFAIFLWGGLESLRRRKDIYEALSRHPLFQKDTLRQVSIARKDAWTRAAIQSKALITIKLQKRWSNRHFVDAIRMTDWFLPVQPQLRIFISNLERQMSDEQKAEWIPKAERFEVFGCYPQTELGHGSNVRGIETTAHLDVATDEFVIHSPTVSSTKCWIGGSGVWATHGLVVARLIINGREYGNHLFLTQLRNLDTQELMPGVNVYELGPKVFQGMLGADTGALSFNQVRVPRTQMLARSAQVTRDGRYIPPQNTKHSYGSMVTVRALMAEITGQDLLKPVAIAYHYTKFRRQFRRDKDNATETPVFEYASVRHRLLPLLAQATALVLVGQRISQAYAKHTAQMLKTGDVSGLEDLHLQTVGAKVYATEICAKGTETCRIACGGHGYSALAGFGRLYAHAVNAVTYEGDNYVIAQQVPRAILKHMKQKTEATLPIISYLSRLRDGGVLPSAPCDLSEASNWKTRDCQRWALEQRLLNMVRQYMDDTDKGLDTSYSAHALIMAHCDYAYWKSFAVDTVDSVSHEPYADAVKSLAQVFSLSVLCNPHHPSLSQNLVLNLEQLAALRQAYNVELNDLGDHYIDMVIEAYGFTEYELDSILARADQTPYEAMLDAAKRSEMSGEKMSHLWPMMIETRQLWRDLEFVDSLSSRSKL